MPIEVLDPTGQINQNQVAERLAKRPSTLTGGIVGLLSNGKPKAEPLLEAVMGHLRARFDLAGEIWHDKTHEASGAGTPAPDWVIDRLSAGTIAVLSASGD